MRVLEVRKPFGIDSLVFTSRPDPVPGPREIVFRPHALSLNYRDRLVIDGFDRWRPTASRIPLSDGSGVVVATGPDVSRVKEGDRVTPIFYPSWIDGEASLARLQKPPGGAIADGLYAEYTVLHESSVVTVPAHLRHVEAATLPCAAVTAWNAVAEGWRPRAGDAVVVLGTGGVALFALQFANLLGARTIVTSSSDAKLARARALGAHAGINYRQTPGWPDAVRDLTGGEGADLVVDTAGSLHEAIDAVRVGGRIAHVGLLGKSRSEIDLVTLMGKSATIRAIDVGSREMFESMNRTIEAAGLHPVIDRTFGFDQAAEAIRYFATGAHFGKVCIQIDDAPALPGVGAS
jgi:NADPH:quinone reductase-like Zn-dependent oxidoreductase